MLITRVLAADSQFQEEASRLAYKCSESRELPRVVQSHLGQDILVMPLILFDILIMPINILSNIFVIKMGGEGHLALVGVQGPSTFSLNVEFITLAAQFGIPGGKLK